MLFKRAAKLAGIGAIISFIFWGSLSWVLAKIGYETLPFIPIIACGVSIGLGYSLGIIYLKKNLTKPKS